MMNKIKTFFNNFKLSSYENWQTINRSQLKSIMLGRMGLSFLYRMESKEFERAGKFPFSPQFSLEEYRHFIMLNGIKHSVLFIDNNKHVFPEMSNGGLFAQLQLPTSDSYTIVIGDKVKKSEIQSYFNSVCKEYYDKKGFEFKPYQEPVHQVVNG
jgi:hypothetical protein